MNQQQLREIAEAAEAEGDFETAIEAMTLHNQMMQDDSFSIDESAAGGLETALAIGSSAIAEPVAGIAGMAQAVNPFAGQGASAEAVEGVRESLSYQPKTEAGQSYMQSIGETLQPLAEGLSNVEQSLGESVLQKTGSPELAAIAHTLPTAVLEALGFGAGKVMSKIPESSAARSAEKAELLTGQADEIRQAQDFGEIPTQEGMKSAAETISKATDEDLQALIQADPELYDAFDRLGVVGELPTEMVSANPQYMELVGGLRSVPGSELKIPFSETIEQVSKQADSLIEELGGNVDTALVSERFKEGVLNSIDNIYESEGKIYDAIDIDKTERFNPSNTIDFLESELEMVGGDIADLPDALKPIYSRLAPKEDGTLPTYGLFNNNRRTVGGQIGKKVDQIESFKSLDSATLKNLYAAMKEDQAAFSAAKGFGEAIDEADKLTIKRKALEGNIKDVLGKNLDKSLMSIVETKTKGLAQKGEVDKFKATMSKIPKAYRQEAAASALSSLFRGTGAGQTAYSANQTAKNLDKLYRSPTAKKALLDELPKGSEQALDALHKVSQQINKATNNTIKTGALRLFDEDSGIIQKMAGKAAGSVTARATGSVAAAKAVDNLLNQSTPRAAAASSLIASPDFQAMIRDAVREGAYDGAQVSAKLAAAEKKIEQSAKFKKWADTLSDDQRVKIANLGIINFLFSEETKREK